MKHVLYLQQNGLVAIISGARGVEVTELEKLVPIGLPHLVVDSEKLPKREHLEYFRDALTADFDSPGQPKIRIDLDKAKNIAKDKIREYREPLFARNDIVIRDAMISNDEFTLKTAVKERDRLKDLTKLIQYETDLDKILEKLENLFNKV